MATYARPKYCKYTVLGVNSIIFIIGMFMIFFTFVQWIGIDDPTQETQRHEPRDRFPSIGALSVQFLFSVICLIVPGTAITAANKDSAVLMQAYGYLVGVGFFLRF